MSAIRCERHERYVPAGDECPGCMTNRAELIALSYRVESQHGHAFTVFQGERVVGYRDSEAEGWELAQEDADSDSRGPCPACGSRYTYATSFSSYATGDCSADRCEDCGNEWNVG